MTSEAAEANGKSGSGPPSGGGWFQVLMELYRVNEQYIQEVVDASRKILRMVLERLVPGDHLKHAPVRTCFRILSGMIFILKVLFPLVLWIPILTLQTFTLGAKEDDVRVSLDLQDKTVEALHTHVVDDVHISNTIARLLELLTTSIRTRFLRFAPLDRAGDSDGHDRTSAPLPVSSTQSPRGGLHGPEGSSHSWHESAHGLGHVDGHNQAGTAIGSIHDPLASIPAQPINSSNINVSFMPPPPSVYHSYYDPHATPTGDPNDPTAAHSMGESSGALPDWFALPLDQFFNSSTAVVDQGLGGTGPMVGEFDMLEVLLSEQYDGAGDGLDSSGTSVPPQFLHS